MAPHSAEREEQARLIRALQCPAVYGHRAERVTLLETHISYVLLTGPYAYKIKKAVDLEFLDFTTLSARHFYCEQELRLNRRLAPAIYLGVVPIAGSVERPVVGGDGPVIEYAVKMREFPQDALLSRVLSQNRLTAAHIDSLAAKVSAFHGRIETAGGDTRFGVPDDILRWALQNYEQIRPLLDSACDVADLDRFRAWTERAHAACSALMRQRQQDGFVRECHGDLHLGNIALVDDEITIFDGIEFNDEMRWIDVMSDVAFLVMDLQDRNRRDLASRFLNAYLECTGDYAGLGVLRFYLAYRAVVRAKVACLRASQVSRQPQVADRQPAVSSRQSSTSSKPGDAKRAFLAEYRDYVNLAAAYAHPPHPAIIITHGVAGCGKTTISQALLELIGAVRIRTDVERKRLHGLGAEARSASPIGGGLYAPHATEETYQRVSALARHVADAGDVAIVDGTFLKRWQRDQLRHLASELDIPFVIVAFSANVATLGERIKERARLGRDASEADEAVLERQLATRESIGPDEQAVTVAYDADLPLDRARSPASWLTVLERLGLADFATSPPSRSFAQTLCR